MVLVLTEKQLRNKKRDRPFGINYAHNIFLFYISAGALRSLGVFTGGVVIHHTLLSHSSCIIDSIISYAVYIKQFMSLLELSVHGGDDNKSNGELF